MNITLPSTTAFATLPLVWLVATIAAFQFGTLLNRLSGGLPIVNPVLIAMTLLIGALLPFEVDYPTLIAPLSLSSTSTVRR